MNTCTVFWKDGDRPSTTVDGFASSTVVDGRLVLNWRSSDFDLTKIVGVNLDGVAWYEMEFAS